MSRIEEIKAEFEDVDIVCELHERVRQLIAYVEAAEAYGRYYIGRTEKGSGADINAAWKQARRALGFNEG